MELFTEFLPIFLFFIAYQTHGIYAATGVAIIASVILAGWQWYKTRHVKRMTLITLGIIVVLGGATIILHDPTFLMWKPTVAYWIFAIILLGSHFIGKKLIIERILGHIVEAPQKVWTRLNIAWITFFISVGIANLAVANPYFVAQQALDQAVGHHVSDIDNCAVNFTGALEQLCLSAKAMESQWVSFKFIGLFGLTLLFGIAQAFYLARHIRAPDESADEIKENN